MPFVMVYGMPNETDLEVLENLRIQLVQTISQMMHCPPAWVRPFFVLDMLSRPTGFESCTTVLVKLETGLFRGRDHDDQHVADVLKAISQDVWNALGGMHEVEISIIPWPPDWSYIIKAVEVEDTE